MKKSLQMLYLIVGCLIISGSYAAYIDVPGNGTDHEQTYSPPKQEQPLSVEQVCKEKADENGLRGEKRAKLMESCIKEGMQKRIDSSNFDPNGG